MFTRRDFARLAATAVPATALSAKPDSKFNGVQIGTITYSFRELPSTAEDILKYCVEVGINSIELMSDPAETYAGAPPAGRGPGGRGAGGRGRGGRAPVTPEQQETMRKSAEERRSWRLAVSMDKYKALRKMYNDAGVSIYAFKLPLTAGMPDDEYEYVFNTTRALGANNITMELPADSSLTRRVGEFADKHRIYIGYHNHTQVNANSWDTALEQSKYNSINLDIGHFTEAINASPIPFIRQHHDRITSAHLKDKKFGSHGGANMPWGQGETPVREVLRLMAKDKYPWPANIELEYDIPADSGVIAEMHKCVAFCKSALS